MSGRKSRMCRVYSNWEFCLAKISLAASLKNATVLVIAHDHIYCISFANFFSLVD